VFLQEEKNKNMNKNEGSNEEKHSSTFSTANNIGLSVNTDNDKLLHQKQNVAPPPGSDGLTRSTHQVVPTLLTEINAAKEGYDTFGDYAELVVQVGFLSLFVVCFPIAPMIAMMSNEAEVKIDLYKLVEMCKHPIPQGAQDIGKWQTFMEMTLYMAAMTNAGMFAFTTDVMASQTFNMKIVAFVAFVLFVQTIKGICAFLIPDIPDEILKIQRRHTSLNESIIRKAILWDDDADEQIDGESFDVKVHWESDTGSTVQ
tara:strand:- start:659 stop:1429 length:771 start_codon:yes stop_codon:yes gene_type:complete